MATVLLEPHKYLGEANSAGMVGWAPVDLAYLLVSYHKNQETTTGKLYCLNLCSFLEFLDIKQVSSVQGDSNARAE